MNFVAVGIRFDSKNGLLESEPDIPLPSTSGFWTVMIFRNKHYGTNLAPKARAVRG